MTKLDGYSKPELHKIVSMYNLELDIDKARATKEQLKKSMMKVGKKKLVNLPSKEDLKGKKTHKMPNGDIHTGKSHTKDSKLVKKAPVKKKKKAPKEDKKQPKINTIFAKKKY